MKRLVIKILSGCLLTLIAIFFLKATSFTDQRDMAVQLFFTADMFGYIKPCG